MISFSSNIVAYFLQCTHVVVDLLLFMVVHAPIMSTNWNAILKSNIGIMCLLKSSIVTMSISSLTINIICTGMEERMEITDLSIAILWILKHRIIKAPIMMKEMTPWTLLLIWLLSPCHWPKGWACASCIYASTSGNFFCITNIWYIIWQWFNN